MHISKGDAEAEYNVITLELIENHGFKNNELRMIEAILSENQEIITDRWNEYFKKGSNK